MTDRWTEARDHMGESWNDLLDDHTQYAKRWERYHGPRAREIAQLHRDSRWRKLDELNRGES